MAEQDNLGDLVVNVTGDYSELQTALNEAQALAGQSGDAIAAAFTQAADASGLAGRDLEIFRSILEADTAAGIELSQSLQDIANSANSLGSEISSGAASALEHLQSAEQDAGAGATEAAGQVEELASATQHASASAEEGESVWASFGEHLLELGGIALTVEGLKELATEAISTYANVEKATIALAALTGSGGKATEAIEGLKTLALTDALSFPSLVTAYQRMTAFGFEAEKIPGVLQSAADAAAATGRNFDTVTNSMERMALSGTAGGRQLATLGISLKDLANALNVADDEAKQAFKDLDVSDRVSVISTALQKYQGVAESVAHGVAGQFQDLKTQTEFVFESIGQAIAPAAEAIMGFASKAVLPSVQLIANSFADLSVAESTFVSDLLEAGKEAATASANMAGLGTSTDQMASAVKAAGKDAFTDAFAPGVRLATAALQAYSLMLEEITNKSPGADQAIQQFTAHLHQLQGAAQMGGDAFKAAFDLSVEEAGLANLSKAAQGTVDSVDALTQKVTTAKDVLAELQKDSDGSARSLQLLAVAENNVEKAQTALDSAMGIAKQTAADYKQSIDGILDSFAKAQTAFANTKGAFDQINQAFRDGTVSVGQYLEAYSKLEGAAKTAGQSFTDIDAEVTKLTQHVTDQETALDTAVQIYNKLKALDIPGSQLAAAEAFDKVTTAAKALGIEVKNTGDSLQFSVSDKSKLAEDAVQGLVDTFQSLYGVEQNTVIVNGKVSQTLQDLAAAAKDGGTFVNQFGIAVSTADSGVIQLKGDVDSASQIFDHTDDSVSALTDSVRQMASDMVSAGEATNQEADALLALAKAADDAAQAQENLNSATSKSGKGGGGGGGGNSAAAAGDALYAAAFGGYGLGSNFISPTGPVAGLGPGGGAGAWNDTNAAQALANATGQIVTLGNATAVPVQNVQALGKAAQTATAATNAQTSAIVDQAAIVAADKQQTLAAAQTWANAIGQIVHTAYGDVTPALTSVATTAAAAASTIATLTTATQASAVSIGALSTAATQVASVAAAVVNGIASAFSVGPLTSTTGPQSTPAAFAGGGPGSPSSFQILSTSLSYSNPNPDMMAAPPGGNANNQGSIQVLVTGNSVTSQALVEQLADKVGAAINKNLRTLAGLKL